MYPNISIAIPERIPPAFEFLTTGRPHTNITKTATIKSLIVKNI